MRSESYNELFQYLRELVKESEYSYFDNLASQESSNILNAKKRLESYLNLLINSFTESSKSSVVNTYERFTNVLKLEDGKEFKGIDVLLSESEASTYDIKQYSLHELDDFGPLIMELKSVLEEVRNGPEPLPPENGPGPGGFF